MDLDLNCSPGDSRDLRYMASYLETVCTHNNVCTLLFVFTASGSSFAASTSCDCRRVALQTTGGKTFRHTVSDTFWYIYSYS